MAKSAGMFAGNVTPLAPADNSPTRFHKGYWWMEYGLDFIAIDCNDIYSAGALTPDLRVAGTVFGVFEEQVIDGVGIIQDERLDNIMTPNSKGEYTSWAGFVLGLQDGLARVYYNECQWYNYAGPAILNTMPGSTYDLSSAGWTASGTGTVAADQPGLAGTGNSSSTLTDSGVDSYRVLRTTSVNQIVADGSPFSSRIIIHKETSAPHWALLIVTINDLPNKQIKVLFNAQTGDANIAVSSSGNNPVVSVRDNGNWWEVYMQFDAQSTPGGATEAILDIRPAANTDGTDSIVVSTSGSIRIGETGVYESGVTIGQIRGSAVEPIGASGGSSFIAKSMVFIDPLNHSDTEGGYYVEWRPLYDDADITGNVEILSLNDSAGLLYYNYTTQTLTATDGTNIATVPVVLVKEHKYHCAVIFGSGLLRVCVDGVWGSSVPYDGAFASGSDFKVCRESEAINYWRELRGFQVSYSAAYDEINLLMAETALQQPFNPFMMTFDGASYYNKSGVTTSGNKITAVAKFNVDSFTGGTFQRLIGVYGGTHWRVLFYLISDDHADTDQRLRLAAFVSSNSGATLCAVVTSSVVVDSADHVAFFSFDGDVGSVQLYVDGISEDNTGWSGRTVTTGTLDSGASSHIGVGSSHDGVSIVDGQVGYAGYRDVYLTNPLDFMTGNVPLELDENDWAEWGSQPLFWNHFGMMTDSKGSAGNLIENGTVTGPEQ